MSSAIAPPVLTPSVTDLQNIHAAELALEKGPAKDRSRWVSILAFGALEGAAGLLGTPSSRRRKNMAWYRTLSKSRATPPDRVFGIVWPALYVAAAVAGARVWGRPASASRTGALTLWGAQLVTNAAWTPLFFGAKRLRLALVDLIALGASVGGFALAARKVDRPAAWLSVPYLAWVGFAGYMNGFIVAKNR